MRDFLFDALADAFKTIVNLLHLLLKLDKFLCELSRWYHFFVIDINYCIIVGWQVLPDHG